MTMARRLRQLLRRRPVVPVVRLHGIIGSLGGLRSGLTLDSVAKPLARAFAVKSAPAVAVSINSPGGSPVQSHLIYQRLRALSAEKKKPVLMFLEDVAASGGYMIALAGDEIIADASSIVGSIGVISAGFGFTGLLEKLGVERRVHTAGDKKLMLDPFQPERESDVAHLKALQAEIHAAFIAMVKERRAGLADDPDLFSGAFWSGAKARSLGLVDHLGDLRSFIRARYGKRVRLAVFTERRSIWRRWMGGPASRLRPGPVDAMIQALEEQAHWRRFGL
jgi:signal peptide peptidase SppA